MVKLTGIKEHSRRLAFGAKKVRDEVGSAIFDAAEDIRADAAASIIQGSISGPGHIPSAPGEPPNRDTAYLDTHILTHRVSQLRSAVESYAPYSIGLEYGTSRVAERPFMRPAAVRGRPRTVDAVVAAVKTALKD